MRFVIREQDYEQLIAAGRLRYRSGAIERWRLTEAVDGFLVMRVDYDRRETAAASSTLMHLLLNPDGRPERLKLRHFAPDNSVDVDVLIDGSVLSVSRNCNEDVTQQELNLPAGFGLLMPATIGLALLVWSSRIHSRALAIELEENGRILLFPADAQVGNWRSWHTVKWQGRDGITAEDLLNRTVCYKVGHHASHNATLGDKGLEMMTSPDLLAVIPLNREMAKKKRWNMPYVKLFERLKTKTNNRTYITDDDDDHPFVTRKTELYADFEFTSLPET